LKDLYIVYDIYDLNIFINWSPNNTNETYQKVDFNHRKLLDIVKTYFTVISR